jgi:hypothetical protein
MQTSPGELHTTMDDNTELRHQDTASKQLRHNSIDGYTQCIWTPVIYTNTVPQPFARDLLKAYTCYRTYAIRVHDLHNMLRLLEDKRRKKENEQRRVEDTRRRIENRLRVQENKRRTVENERRASENRRRNDEDVESTA